MDGGNERQKPFGPFRTYDRRYGKGVPDIKSSMRY
jgi:hypothetical protein